MSSQQILGIPAASDNQAAAGLFLAWITSAKSQTDFSAISPIFPSATAVVSAAGFAEAGDDPTINSAKAVLVKSAPKLVDGSLGSRNDEQLRGIFDEQVRAFMTGSTSAKDALSTAATQWNAAMKTL